MKTNISIIDFIKETPLGEPFAIQNLLEHGSYANVRQVLSRLTRKGEITRVSRGIYVRPQKSKFLGTVLPQAEKIIENISEKTGESIVPSGAEAANILELSTQVPMQKVFLTTGYTRSVQIGSNRILLQHVSPRKIFTENAQVGLAISALWYLGKRNVTMKTVTLLKKKLSAYEWMILCDQAVFMPRWMSEIFYRYAREQQHGY